MGVIAYEMMDYREAKPWLVRAMELYEEVADKAGMAEAVFYIGCVDLKLTNYEQAIQHHALGVPLTESLGNRALAGRQLLQAA